MTLPTSSSPFTFALLLLLLPLHLFLHLCIFTSPHDSRCFAFSFLCHFFLYLLLLFEHDFSGQVLVRWFKLALLSSQRPAQVLTQRRRRDPLSSLSTRSHQVRTATRASK
jgi:hypothetical protein